ncbi:thiosulfate oxidation carrier complex protein SoxZ [Methylohalobius crimeensis]|uniref:thiosulfate oxidation carrier complex protein SoxZ n=1 Tax=Methylohalobius crimeensis TaxID=244365 RepID=UPI0003B6F5DC|nr:thiosulfate oxidation carrier complex protein SoxZ [Methylohalobius crimeensis]
MRIQHRSLRLPDGTVEIRLLLSPSETRANRADRPTGCLKRLALYFNGKRIMAGSLGKGVTTDPLLTFRLNASRPGQLLEIHWRDDRDNQGRLTIQLP